MYHVEIERSKSSIEIASVFHHTLKKFEFSNVIKIVVMVAEDKIKQREVVFPVAGHLFMPLVRIFCNVEKDTNKYRYGSFFVERVFREFYLYHRGVFNLILGTEDTFL